MSSRKYKSLVATIHEHQPFILKTTLDGNPVVILTFESHGDANDVFEALIGEEVAALAPGDKHEDFDKVSDVG